jgi:hypothetical protein
VEVAFVKLAMPPIERREPGVEVPTPKEPLGSSVRAAAEEVAVPARVVVAKYRVPFALRKVHWENPAPAVRESWGAVVEAMVSAYEGVVVPTPTEPRAFQMPEGKFVAPVKVEEAILMSPPVKPTMVEVDTPYVVGVKGKIWERLEEDILLLKVLQSAAAKQPKVEASAVLQLKALPE